MEERRSQPIQKLADPQNHLAVDGYQRRATAARPIPSGIESIRLCQLPHFPRNTRIPAQFRDLQIVRAFCGRPSPS